MSEAEGARMPDETGGFLEDFGGMSEQCHTL